MQRAWPLLFSLIIIAAVLSIPDLAHAQTGNIRTVQDPEMIGPGDKITILIEDGGLDANPNRIDEYDAEDIELVTFRTDRDELGEASPDLKETGRNTGVFEFSIQLDTDDESCDEGFFVDPSFGAVGGSNPSIGVCPGDILTIGYEDFYTANGGEAVISYSVEIKSWDPEFAADKAFYYAGDRVTVTIIDFDADRDPDIADSIRDIRVFSETDEVGQEFSAIETGRNTGIFRLTFTTSLENQGNAIHIRDGDELTVEYIDEFPAEFALGDRTNSFFMIIGTSDERATLVTSTPQLKTTGEPAAGKQTTLAVNVINYDNQLIPFIEIIEVRNAEGVTVLLAWQGGELEPLEQKEIGILWIPDESGDYEIRTFIISDLVNPQVLSDVATSTVTIS